MKRALLIFAAVACLTTAQAAVVKYEEVLAKKGSGTTNLQVLGGASVYVYEPGCVAATTGTGSSITVYSCSNIVVDDTIEVNGQTATVVGVPDTITVNLDVSVSWNQYDPLLVTNSPATIYSDPAGLSSITQPATSDSNGVIRFYINPSVYPKFDLKAVSGSRLLTLYDEYRFDPTTGTFSVISVTDLDAKTINDIRFAKDYATGGAGTIGDPYTGWEVAVAGEDNVEVWFNPSAAETKTYYSVPDAGISLGSNVALRGVGNVVLTFTAARAVVNPMLRIPGGETDVLIEGLEFYAGVDMSSYLGPDFIDDGTQGESYIEIGTPNSGTAAERVTIARNRFTTMRHDDGGAGGGFHIQFWSSKGVTITENFFDRAKAGIVQWRGHATEQYVAEDHLIESNRFVYAHEHDQLGYAIEYARENAALPAVLGTVRNVAIIDNHFENVDAGIHGVTLDGNGFLVQGNSFVGDDLDWCMDGEDANTALIEELRIIDNHCIGTAAASLASWGVWYAKNALVQGNTLISLNQVAPLQVRYSEGTLVQGNVISREGASEAGYSACVYTGNLSSDTLIDGNFFRDCESAMVSMDGQTGALVRGNILNDTNASANLIRFSTGTGPNTKINVVNNYASGTLVSAFSNDPAPIGLAYGNVVKEATSAVSVRNQKPVRWHESAAGERYFGWRAATEFDPGMTSVDMVWPTSGAPTANDSVIECDTDYSCEWTLNASGIWLRNDTPTPDFVYTPVTDGTHDAVCIGAGAGVSESSCDIYLDPTGRAVLNYTGAATGDFTVKGGGGSNVILMDAGLGNGTGFGAIGFLGTPEVNFLAKFYERVKFVEPIVVGADLAAEAGYEATIHGKLYATEALVVKQQTAVGGDPNRIQGWDNTVVFDTAPTCANQATNTWTLIDTNTADGSYNMQLCVENATGVWDFSPSTTALPIPTGTGGATFQDGGLYLDTNGDGTSLTDPFLEVDVGASQKYAFLLPLPVTDNHILKYDSASKSIGWEVDDSGGSPANLSSIGDVSLSTPGDGAGLCFTGTLEDSVDCTVGGDLTAVENAGTWEFDLVEANVETELEGVLDLPDLQGQIADAQIADGAVDGGSGGEIADNSVTGADIADAYCGTRLTESGGNCNADAELYTDSVSIFKIDWDVADEIVFRAFPVAATVTRIECEAYSGTSFEIKVCKGKDIGDDTCTTNLLDATESTTLLCDSTPPIDTTINSGSLTARQQLTIVVTASTADPNGEVYIEATLDD